MKKILIIIAICIIGMPPIASRAASLQRGPYTSVFIGATIPQSQDVSSFNYVTAGTYSDRVEFDPGIFIGGTGGYDFGYVRVESEISYKYSTIKSITENGSGYQFQNIDGNIGALAVMFNTFIDIHNRSRVTPYIGGGIGYASLYLSNTYGTTMTYPYSRPLLYSEDYASVFAYQLGAGIEIALNRRLSLDIGYRYFCTDTANIGNNTNSPIVTSIKMETHNATAGVRFKF